MSAMCLRFAPSPNGALHSGHALSALLNAEAARRLGGQFLLRIEDIDTQRSSEAHIASMRDDLAWLGIIWPRPEWRQSTRMAVYEAALERLKAAHLVYPCFASRSEIASLIEQTPEWPCDPDGSPLYPGIWRDADAAAIGKRLAAEEKPAWRLDMQAALERAGSQKLSWHELGGGYDEYIHADPGAWGDVVIARKDILTSYHLAVVMDDALQNVSHVIRGRDLYHATGLHRLLQHLLDLPTPTYLHHRLLLGPDGRKLSKSAGSASLSTLRVAGVTLSDLLQSIEWAPEHDLAGI